ncbi:unnamed protein product [Hymenolepis diminuta]|uniref:Alpha/beta hydrolase n=1 Tax=Hymenolepis diminuta TaxID=6216 RepID=A0A0R3SG89_HYMDI|nr:unnamed protein product [Hymenolepis diminuta]
MLAAVSIKLILLPVKKINGMDFIRSLVRWLQRYGSEIYRFDCRFYNGGLMPDVASDDPDKHRCYYSSYFSGMLLRQNIRVETLAM